MRREYAEAKLEAETELADAWQEILDGRAELADAWQKIQDGKRNFADAKATLAREAADAVEDRKGGKKQMPFLNWRRENASSWMGKRSWKTENVNIRRAASST